MRGKGKARRTKHERRLFSICGHREMSRIDSRESICVRLYLMQDELTEQKWNV
jgi:hypothetical protein